jgi:uncharacterized protein (TIGR02145 family)
MKKLWLIISLLIYVFSYAYCQSGIYDITYSPPFNNMHYSHYQDIKNPNSSVGTSHGFNSATGELQHGCGILTKIIELNNVSLQDVLYFDCPVQKSGHYSIEFDGYVSGGFWNLSLSPYGDSKGAIDYWLSTYISPINSSSIIFPLYKTDLSDAELTLKLVITTIASLLEVGDIVDVSNLLLNNIIPEKSFSESENKFLIKNYVYLEEGTTYRCYFNVNSVSASASLGAAGNLVFFDTKINLQKISLKFEDNYLEIIPNSQKVSKEAGSTTFTVNSNINWGVANDKPTWLNTYKTNNNTITATYSSNLSQEERTANILVSGNGVSQFLTLVQKGEEVYLNINPPTKTLSSDAGTTTITVNSNINWQFASNADWITVSKTNSNLLTVNYLENNFLLPRTAEVIFYGTNVEPQIVTITQNGKDLTRPTLSTALPSNISSTTAISGGNITSDGGASITTRGVCWSTSPNPTVALITKTSNGTGNDPFTSYITGLYAGTTYYLRAYAINSEGPAYGNEISFKTYNSDAIVDFDGNYYNIVRIGSQVWMAENLKTTKYNDGNTIPNVTDDNTWEMQTSGAFCWYNNDALTYKKTYGALYNWFAVNTNKLCPTGWSVPTDGGWTNLTDYLTNNGYGYEGSGNDIAKSMAAEYNWTTSTIQGTIGNDQSHNNASGFSALPGGSRFWNSELYFMSIKNSGFWWCATEYNEGSSWYCDLAYNASTMGKRPTGKYFGLSVRCVKDIISNLSVAPSNVTVASILGATGNINISSNTSWSVIDDATWLNLSSSSGTGNGTLTVTTNSANTLINPRSANVTFSASGVSSVIVTVTQSGSGPILSVNPSNINVTSSSGSFDNFNVVSNTNWTVTENCTWFNLSSGTGSGNGPITVTTTSANTSTNPRSANVTFSASGVSPVIVTVTQSGSGPKLSVNPSNINMSYSSGSFDNFNVVSNTNWTVTENCAWFNLSSGSGSGNGSITVTKTSANTSTSPRSANVTFSASGVSSVIVTVTQDGTGPTLSVAPPSIYVASTSGATGNFNVTSNTNWTVIDNATWLNLSSPSGTGNGTLIVTTTSANTSNNPRTANVTFSAPGVSSVIVTVAQNAENLTLPILSTNAISKITKTTAISGGSIISDDQSVITVKGVCWSTNPNPTVTLTTKTNNGIGSDSFTSNISGLSPSKRYYLRAYATNSIGIAYGEEISFKTYNFDAINDIDENYYNIIEIGNQVWLEENLRTTKFNDGNLIPTETDNATWTSLVTPAYCWYNNDVLNKDIYGALYNWHSINTGKLCPSSWHVPSDDEWTILIDFLEGESVAGGKLKEIGTTHWVSPNTGATNESGFNAVPAGSRYIGVGLFGHLGQRADWWSSNLPYSYSIWNYQESVFRGSFGIPEYGFSVRCIQNGTLTPDKSKSAIKIFPNPVVGLLTIDYNDDNRNFKTIYILDSQGKLLVKEKAVFPIQQIDFSKFEYGLYILEFNNPKGVVKRIKIVHH